MDTPESHLHGDDMSLALREAVREALGRARRLGVATMWAVEVSTAHGS